MLSIRRIAMTAGAIGALAVVGPVAGASAATLPVNPLTTQVTAAQNAWAEGATAAQGGFAAGAAAAQSGWAAGAAALQSVWGTPFNTLQPLLP
jgi:hypothetical protein